jgi:sugar lactone lactonase YvrE
VVADGRGSLWVLDPASPFLENTVPGGPKLVQIDLGSDEVTRVYRFDEQAAPQNSYLNDVRIDHDRRRAYITDSGSPALVVLDLDSGRAVRVLEDHMSTRAEDIQLTIGGEAWVGPGGQTPAVHADGIALSPDGQWVYYKALTGRTLYRVPAAMLAGVLDNDAAEGLADAVEDLGQTVACDGMVMDGNGWLYLTALEQDAILALQPGTGGPLRTLVADPRLQWPDTLAIGPGGGLYITTAQIHLQPRFNDGMDMVTAPYRVWFVDARLEPNW